MHTHISGKQNFEIAAALPKVLYPVMPRSARTQAGAPTVRVRRRSITSAESGMRNWHRTESRSFPWIQAIWIRRCTRPLYQTATDRNSSARRRQLNTMVIERMSSAIQSSLRKRAFNVILPAGSRPALRMPYNNLPDFVILFLEPASPPVEIQPD
jgi:hypothetical protein